MGKEGNDDVIFVNQLWKIYKDVIEIAACLN